MVHALSVKSVSGLVAPNVMGVGLLHGLPE